MSPMFLVPPVSAIWVVAGGLVDDGGADSDTVWLVLVVGFGMLALAALVGLSRSRR